MSDLLLQHAELSLRAGLLIGIILLLRPLFLRLTGPEWMSGLWWLGGVRLLIPLAAVPLLVVPVPWLTPETAATTVPQVTISYHQPSAPVSTQLALDSLSPMPFSWLSGLALALAAGAFLLLCRLGMRQVRTNRLIHCSHTLNEGAAAEVFAALPADLTRGTQLRSNSQISAPAIGGLLKPCILIPTHLELSRTEWCHVLLHELGHLRRGDLWGSLLMELAVCLHWFNPLAWQAARVAGHDREMACDAWTLKRLNEPHPHLYTQTLMKIIRNARHLSTRQPANVIAMASTSTHITERLHHAYRIRPRCRPGAIALTALALLLTTFSATHFIPGASAAGRSSSPEAADSPSPRIVPPVTPLKKELRDTILPEANFKKVPLHQAARFLRQQWAEINAEAPPLSIVISDKVRTKSITLSLKQISFEQVLNFMTKVTGTQWNLKAGTVTISAADHEAKTGAAAAAQNSGKADGKFYEVTSQFIELPASQFKQLMGSDHLPGENFSMVALFEPSEWDQLREQFGKNPEAEVLSAPKVTLPESQRAVIEINRQFRYPSEFHPSDGASEGNAAATADKKENLGVTLHVQVERQPPENGREILALQLTQAFVELIGHRDAGGGSPTIYEAPISFRNIGEASAVYNPQAQPIFNRKTGTTEVNIYEGQTVVLASSREPILVSGNGYDPNSADQRVLLAPVTVSEIIIPSR